MQSPIRSRILEDVLKIIDEEMKEAANNSDMYPESEQHTHGWRCRYYALKDLRERLTEDMEDN